MGNRINILIDMSLALSDCKGMNTWRNPSYAATRQQFAKTKTNKVRNCDSDERKSLGEKRNSTTA